MQPTLDSEFLSSSRWQQLSRPAQCALEGLLQFVIPQHGEWVVEGTPKELGGWIGPDSNLGADKIVQGLRELYDAGCIKRQSCGYGVTNKYIIPASIIER